jgi:hypothetical protein
MEKYSVKTIPEYEELVDTLKEHERIESIWMNKFPNYGPTDFYSFLESRKLKELKVKNSFRFESFVNLLEKLNENESLNHLDISRNRYFNYEPTDWNEFKITNKTLQTFNMNGDFNLLNCRF